MMNSIVYVQDNKNEMRAKMEGVSQSVCLTIYVAEIVGYVRSVLVIVTKYSE